MNKIKAWYKFANRVWISLSLGWGALILGLTPLIRLDQAGALHRLFVHQVQPVVSTGYIYQEVDVPGESRKDIIITQHQGRSGSVAVNTDIWTLYHLAKCEEFYEYQNTRAWELECTMKRIERRVDYAIVISTVVGTFLWAFG